MSISSDIRPTMRDTCDKFLYSILQHTLASAADIKERVDAYDYVRPLLQRSSPNAIPFLLYLSPSNAPLHPHKKKKPSQKAIPHIEIGVIIPPSKSREFINRTWNTLRLRTELSLPAYLIQTISAATTAPQESTTIHHSSLQKKTKHGKAKVVDSNHHTATGWTTAGTASRAQCIQLISLDLSDRRLTFKYSNTVVSIIANTQVLTESYCGASIVLHTLIENMARYYKSDRYELYHLILSAEQLLITALASIPLQPLAVRTMLIAALNTSPVWMPVTPLTNQLTRLSSLTDILFLFSTYFDSFLYHTHAISAVGPVSLSVLRAKHLRQAMQIPPNAVGSSSLPSNSPFPDATNQVGNDRDPNISRTMDGHAVVAIDDGSALPIEQVYPFLPDTMPFDLPYGYSLGLGGSPQTSLQATLKLDTDQRAGASSNNNGHANSHKESSLEDSASLLHLENIDGVEQTDQLASANRGDTGHHSRGPSGSHSRHPHIPHEELQSILSYLEAYHITLELPVRYNIEISPPSASQGESEPATCTRLPDSGSHTQQEPHQHMHGSETMNESPLTMTANAPTWMRCAVSPLTTLDVIHPYLNLTRHLSMEEFSAFHKAVSTWRTQLQRWVFCESLHAAKSSSITKSTSRALDSTAVTLTNTTQECIASDEGGDMNHQDESGSHTQSMVGSADNPTDPQAHSSPQTPRTFADVLKSHPLRKLLRTLFPHLYIHDVAIIPLPSSVSTPPPFRPTITSQFKTLDAFYEVLPLKTLSSHESSPTVSTLLSWMVEIESTQYDICVSIHHEHITTNSDSFHALIDKLYNSMITALATRCQSPTISPCLFTTCSPSRCDLEFIYLFKLLWFVTSPYAASVMSRGRGSFTQSQHSGMVSPYYSAGQRSLDSYEHSNR